MDFNVTPPYMMEYNHSSRKIYLTMIGTIIYSIVEHFYLDIEFLPRHHNISSTESFYINKFNTTTIDLYS